MPAIKMREFLDKNHIRYATVKHSPAYTAQAVAASAHVPIEEMVKTVMIEVDGKMAMAVLPAPNQIEFDELKLAVGTVNVNLLHENDFKDRFPDCEPGAMPPFGNLYGMPVFVADSLAQDDYMAFSAGSHHEVVIMTYADYARLVSPRVVKFSAEILALPN
jgi:Ala-tRNA(Pro) deacylase